MVTLWIKENNIRPRRMCKQKAYVRWFFSLAKILQEGKDIDKEFLVSSCCKLYKFFFRYVGSAGFLSTVFPYAMISKLWFVSSFKYV